MNEINFLPASYLYQRGQRRRSLIHLAMIGTALIAGVAFWTVQRGQTASMRREVESLEAQAQTVQQQRTASAKLLTEYKALLHQTRVQRELAQPVTQTQVLSVLGDVLPSTVTLTQVEVAATRPKPASMEDAAAKPKPGSKKSAGAKAEAAASGPEYLTIRVQGVAPDDLTVANLVGTLSEHPLFGEVRLRHSRAVSLMDATVRNFEMTMRVDLQRDIRPRREGVARAD